MIWVNANVHSLEMIFSEDNRSASLPVGHENPFCRTSFIGMYLIFFLFVKGKKWENCNSRHFNLMILQKMWMKAGQVLKVCCCNYVVTRPSGERRI